MTRDGDEWFDSYCHFQAKLGKTIPDPSERVSMISSFHERNERVSARLPVDRLLIMNIFEGDGYDKLCPFLEQKILDEPFPLSNQTRK